MVQLYLTSGQSINIPIRLRSDFSSKSWTWQRPESEKAYFPDVPKINVKSYIDRLPEIRATTRTPQVWERPISQRVVVPDIRPQVTAVARKIGRGIQSLPSITSTARRPMVYERPPSQRVPSPKLPFERPTLQEVEEKITETVDIQRKTPQAGLLATSLPPIMVTLEGKKIPGYKPIQEDLEKIQQIASERKSEYQEAMLAQRKGEFEERDLVPTEEEQKEEYTAEVTRRIEQWQRANEPELTAELASASTVEGQNVLINDYNRRLEIFADKISKDIAGKYKASYKKDWETAEEIAGKEVTEDFWSGLTTQERFRYDPYITKGLELIPKTEGELVVKTAIGTGVGFAVAPVIPYLATKAAPIIGGVKATGIGKAASLGYEGYLAKKGFDAFKSFKKGPPTSKIATIGIGAIAATGFVIEAKPLVETAYVRAGTIIAPGKYVGSTKIRVPVSDPNKFITKMKLKDGKLVPAKMQTIEVGKIPTEQAKPFMRPAPWTAEDIFFPSRATNKIGTTFRVPKEGGGFRGWFLRSVEGRKAGTFAKWYPDEKFFVRTKFPSYVFGYSPETQLLYQGATQNIIHAGKAKIPPQIIITTKSGQKIYVTSLKPPADIPTRGQPLPALYGLPAETPYGGKSQAIGSLLAGDKSPIYQFGIDSKRPGALIFQQQTIKTLPKRITNPWLSKDISTKQFYEMQQNYFLQQVKAGNFRPGFSPLGKISTELEVTALYNPKLEPYGMESWMMWSPGQTKYGVLGRSTNPFYVEPNVQPVALIDVQQAIKSGGGIKNVQFSKEFRAAMDAARKAGGGKFFYSPGKDLTLGQASKAVSGAAGSQFWKSYYEAERITKVFPPIVPTPSYNYESEIKYSPPYAPTVSFTPYKQPYRKQKPYAPPTGYAKPPKYSPPSTPYVPPGVPVVPYVPPVKYTRPPGPYVPPFTPTRFKPYIAEGEPYIPYGRGGMKKKKKKSRGYKLFIRRRGKWLKTGPITTKGRALKKGSKITQRTLAASFKIVPTKKIIPVGDIKFAPSPKVFRKPKGKTKIKPLEQTFVQRGGIEPIFVPSARLASRGERAEILGLRSKKKVKFL